MSQEGFYKLFLKELRNLYDAENQLVEALPRMAEAAQTEELSDAIKTHLKETKNQVKRLEKIFTMLNENSSGEICEPMQSLIKVGNKAVKSESQSILKDAEIIGCAQQIE